MDIQVQRRFAAIWSEYFAGAELPIIFFYTENARLGEPAPTDSPHCIVCTLEHVRRGTALRFDGESVLCGGGRRYLGFSQALGPRFKYFLSCGIPGEMEGERYKKTPELVEKWIRESEPLRAPGRYIVFKRWDTLTAEDEPTAVIFFAAPDVLAGLFTLANYDEADPQAVIAPMGSGCSSIVYHPYNEAHSRHPRAVLGMFDVSARPCVPATVLTFAVPWPMFLRMVDNAGESFLVTPSWDKVRARLHA